MSALLAEWLLSGVGASQQVALGRLSQPDQPLLFGRQSVQAMVEIGGSTLSRFTSRGGRSCAEMPGVVIATQLAQRGLVQLIQDFAELCSRFALSAVKPRRIAWDGRHIT